MKDNQIMHSKGLISTGELVKPSASFSLPVITVSDVAYIKSNCLLSEIESTLKAAGAVLIRGAKEARREDFENLLSGLNYTPMPYKYGVSPRSQVSSSTSTSTEAPDFLPIGVHTEMAYTHIRPRYISFFCECEPRIYGETPIVNNFDVFDDINSDLMNVLRQKQLGYRRYFLKGKKRFSFEQRIIDIFGTENREEISQLSEDAGISCEWQANGDLVTFERVNPIVRHPETQRLALNLNLFHADALSYDYEQLKDRYFILKWFAVNQLQRIVRNSHKSTIRTEWGDGTPIEKEFARTIQQIYWNHTTVFSWQKGDILLLDNIAFSHGRLNVSGPRKILASLSNPYNFKDTIYQ